MKSNARQIPLKMVRVVNDDTETLAASKTALCKRIQRLEEENAALREALNAGKPEYTDHNCRLENGQWVVVCEKAEKTLPE